MQQQVSVNSSVTTPLVQVSNVPRGQVNSTNEKTKMAAIGALTGGIFGIMAGGISAPFTENVTAFTIFIGCTEGLLAGAAGSAAGRVASIVLKDASRWRKAFFGAIGGAAMVFPMIIGFSQAVGTDGIPVGFSGIGGAITGLATPAAAGALFGLLTYCGEKPINKVLSMSLSGAVGSVAGMVFGASIGAAANITCSLEGTPVGLGMIVGSTAGAIAGVCGVLPVFDDCGKKKPRTASEPPRTV